MLDMLEILDNICIWVLLVMLYFNELILAWSA